MQQESDAEKPLPTVERQANNSSPYITADGSQVTISHTSESQQHLHDCESPQEDSIVVSDTPAGHHVSSNWQSHSESQLCGTGLEPRPRSATHGCTPFGSGGQLLEVPTSPPESSHEGHDDPSVERQQEGLLDNDSTSYDSAEEDAAQDDNAQHLTGPTDATSDDVLIIINMAQALAARLDALVAHHGEDGTKAILNFPFQYMLDNTKWTNSIIIDYLADLLALDNEVPRHALVFRQQHNLAVLHNTHALAIVLEDMLDVHGEEHLRVFLDAQLRDMRAKTERTAKAMRLYLEQVVRLERLNTAGKK